MDQSSSSVRALEERVRALELGYTRLAERLRNVGAALGGSDAVGTLAAEARSPAQPPRQGGRPAPTASPTALLRQPEAKASPPAASRSTPTKLKPGASAKKATRAAQTNGQRKGFEKGEALTLFRGILKQPMRTRDLMARVIAAKRTSQLPKQDMERFKWAVHSALKEGVRVKAIVRQADGTIALASGNTRAASKGPKKATK